MQLISDPNLEFEKTVAYELGFDINLGIDYQFHAGAFYKNNSDLANIMTYAHTNQSLIMDFHASIGYSEIRGIELEFRKTFGRFITGWINFNYIKKSKSNLKIPKLSENPIWTDDPNIGFNGEVRGVPLSDIKFVQPYAQGVMTLMGPEDWGPRLWGYPVLENTNLSFQVFYQGGARVEHPSQSFRELYPEIWFHELDRFWVNMRLARKFQMVGVDFELYMDVSNIIHSTFRYPPGGRSGEDYYNDLWNSGRLDEVGTDELSNSKILRTENDDVYWARDKRFLFGLRVNI
jgi:outer membrane receptor protein involved in Fe transport